MNGLESVYGREYGNKGMAAAGSLGAAGAGAESLAGENASAAIPNMPDKKFKAGGVTATVWKGVSPKGAVYFNVQISRSYKDKDNNWKTASSFKESDLPKAMVLLQKAYEYVIGQQSNAILS
ncbi:hypothetical protein HYY73_00380 [Candidatus Woesearchaeota archaeon]|nr:hypothetical protein [Candidatus Woesearchaeota archaeon]